MEEVKEVQVKAVDVLEENNALKAELSSMRQELKEIKSMISSQIKNIPTYSNTDAYGFPTDLPSLTSSFPLFSIGNEGVPTNRQTSIQQTEIKASSALESVSALRAELKIKFRNLTKQEFKVFSAVYILEQQQPVGYRALAEKLRLSEGSIRDYIMKIERKGIPIHKEKINNKTILLHVRQELRDLVSLEAIMQIRESAFK